MKKIFILVAISLLQNIYGHLETQTCTCTYPQEQQPEAPVSPRIKRKMKAWAQRARERVAARRRKGSFDQDTAISKQTNISAKKADNKSSPEESSQETVLKEQK